MAEWLGRGLQNLVQRFESASDHKNKAEQTTFKSSVLFLSPSPSASTRQFAKPKQPTAIALRLRQLLTLG